MERTSARRRQLRWWHSWKLYTRQIRNPRAMLLRQWRSVQTRSRHGRQSYVRATCPDTVRVHSTRDHIRFGGDCVGLFPRLALRSKCFPKPDPRVAARSVYEWSRLSLGCCRVSTCRTRSSVTHDSHGEASSIDDGCCTANSGWGTRISVGMRVTEALH